MTPNAAPHAPILELTFATVLSRALYAVTQRGIPDVLAAGPATPDEVAAKVGVHPIATLQVLRALASAGIFTQGSDGRYGLTPVGETLVEGHPTAARDLVLTFGAPGFWTAVSEMPAVLETGRTGVQIAFDMSAFDYLRQHPDEEALFNRTMIAVHGGEPAAVAAAYDFSGIRTLVDVGGGLGTMLVTLLEANPALAGVLFDAPTVVEVAKETIGAAGLESRVTRVGGDFFASVPAGSDAYVLSHVLHDWDVESCHTILRNCRDAMNPGGRILIVEMVLPPGAEPHPGKMLDLLMLSLAGGRERTAEEYAELVAPVGLRIERVVPTLSPVSVVEVVPA
ncbi:MAG TPA: methyltransferase [Sporichthyaceae bacterium]